MHWFRDQGWTTGPDVPRCTVQSTSISMVLPEAPLRRALGADASGTALSDEITFTSTKPYEEIRVETECPELGWAQTVASWLEAAMEVYGDT